MYRYILGFQIVCILVSGGCLYLAITDDKLRTKSYIMSATAVFSGIFLTEISYGLYLQATAMAGLQMAEKFCLLGKLLTAVSFFVTCVSLSDRDSDMVKMAAGIFGLTAAVFFFSESLSRLLYESQNFLQNQYFYYIEGKLTVLGELFRFCIRCLPLFGFLWLIFRKKEKSLREKLFLSATVLFWAVSYLSRDMTLLRHYDADMPLCAAFACCLCVLPDRT